jgi:hypothetical protein
MAQNIIISGVMIAHTINSRRCKAMRILPSLEHGIFGWIDTQVQANIVARQVQRISQVDLCFVDTVGVETRTLVELKERESESTRGTARVWAFAMQNRATMRDVGEGLRQYFVLAHRLINQSSHEAVQKISG